MYSTQSSDGKTKLAGRSKARVIDNRDPLQRGRIRVDHPQLGATTWIDYLRVPGHFSAPGIGNVVYVECDTGVHTHPIAWGNVTIGPDDTPQLPTEFQRDIPSNRGLFTPGGHLIEMDDGEATLTQEPNDTAFTTSGRGIRVTTSGNNKIHIIEDSDAKQTYILLQDANGNYIKLDYNNNTLSIHSTGDLTNFSGKNTQQWSENNLTTFVRKDKQLNVEGNSVDNITGNQTQNINGSLLINVIGNASISADILNIDAATSINLGAGAFDSVIKGDAFKTYLDTHTHTVISIGTPTSTPIVPMPPSTLSNLVKVK